MSDEDEESDYEDDSQAVIISMGSDTTKVGFAGDDAPLHIIPTVLAYPSKLHKKVSVFSKDCYVGDEALSKLSENDSFSALYPYQYSQVCNWDQIEKLWHHTFYNALRIQTEERCVLLSAAVDEPKSNREKATQIMFETFNTPAFYHASNQVLSLYASGRTTGLTVDCGSDICYFTPIYEGYALPHAIKRMELGGKQLTQWLYQQLTNKYSDVTQLNLEVARDIKHKLGYTAVDLESEIIKYETMQSQLSVYQLPDGTKIEIGSERFQCCEPLFNPQLLEMNTEMNGIQHSIIDSINGCDTDIRLDLYENLVLGGGTTLFNGFAQRTKRELQRLSPNGLTVKVVSPPDRQYSAWMGGSILASLSTFQEMWTTKDEYDEYPPGFIRRRPF